MLGFDPGHEPGGQVFRARPRAPSKQLDEDVQAPVLRIDPADLLDDELFLSFLTDKMKTICKLNGLIGFGTQSAADIARSRAAHTLIEQSATNIFFPNTKADEHSYREAFRLSERELGWVRETGPCLRTFLIKHGRDSVIARLT